MDINITWDQVPWVNYKKQIPHNDTDGALIGWVVTHEGSRLGVVTPSGPVSAEISGKLRHITELGAAEAPAVGDFVTLRSGTPAQIESTLPRKSAFRRKEAGGRTEAQVICANADTAIIVTTAPGMGEVSPDTQLNDFSLRRVERYIATLDPRITPIVVLNKCDLVADPQAVRSYVAAELPGAVVVALSALTGEGTEVLEALIEPGHVAVIVGSSGCGKSTLINKLMDSTAAGNTMTTDRTPDAGAADPVVDGVARTGHVRSSDGRGRHTTTTRSLYALPSGGIVVDTPGMREVQVWAEDGGNGDPIAEAFPEIAELEGECKFSDCRHEHEPGCAVKEALLDGRVLPDRYRSYLQLREEAGMTAEMRLQKRREWGRRIARLSRQIKKERNR